MESNIEGSNDRATRMRTEQPNSKESFAEESDTKNPKTEGLALPHSLMKALRRRSSSVIGSNGSNSGSEHNSDNSGLVSFGNNDFGFNFDTEEGMNNSASNSEEEGKNYSGEDPRIGVSNDSAHGSEMSEEGQQKPQTMNLVSSSEASKTGGESSSGSDWKSSVSSLSSDSKQSDPASHHAAAAAAAVANLHSIARQHTHSETSNDGKKPPTKKPAEPSMTNKSLPPFTRKRASQDSEDLDTGGYNSEADGEQDAVSYSATPNSSSSSAADNVAVTRSKRLLPTPLASHAIAESTAEASVTQRGGQTRKKAKKLDESKREERNAREKERSYRISKQIDELRNLLSNGGVIVPKGTKSSVLTEAANYIRMLQQHQYRSEIDRHQLVQQMQVIGGGALGPEAANAVRHVAAQNGVWSLGNFGGVPPKSAMTYYHQSSKDAATAEEATSQGADAPISATVREHDYRFIFNSSPVGMAIASMGGAFIDCNTLFCQLSNYSKQEVCSMTIFNLTSRQDLQHAFDLISQMISPATEGDSSQKPAPCVLRGSMKNRDDLGLRVGLIRGDDGIAKCFCVTLIKNPSSPFDTSRPVPATADFIIPETASPAKDAISSAPAYTAG